MAAVNFKLLVKVIESHDLALTTEMMIKSQAGERWVKHVCFNSAGDKILLIPLTSSEFSVRTLDAFMGIGCKDNHKIYVAASYGQAVTEVERIEYAKSKQVLVFKIK